MENKDSNMKPQETGHLNLMTVFIAVLALHVVVIGGITVYHLMSGGNSDTDVVTLDKSHKIAKAGDDTNIADANQADASQADKGAPTATAPPEVAATPAPTPAASTTPSAETTPAPSNPPTPASDSASSTEPSTTPAPAPAPVSAPNPAPAPTMTPPQPTAPPPASQLAENGSQTPTGPIVSNLAPPPELAPTPSAPEESIAPGPVHMPPAMAAVPMHEHSPSMLRTHGSVYVVKITDSYPKIAHTHHVTVAELKQVNHIKGDVLHTGQRLIIPSGHAIAAAYVSNTSLDATPTHLMLANSVSSTVTPGLSHHHFYTVVRGDTLVKIAHRFRTTATAIMDVNDITDPAKLTIGKKLRIPSQESRSARNVVPRSPQPREVQSRPDDEASGQLTTFVP
jgi:LysM repeat protein